MRNNKNARDYLKEKMKEILLDNQINIGEDEDKTLDLCTSLLLRKEPCYIDSKDLKIGDIDNYFIFQTWNNKMSVDDFIKNLEAKFREAKIVCNYIKIFFIVNDIKQQLQLKDDIKKSKIKENVKKIFNKVNEIKITNKEVELEIMFFNPIEPSKFQIGIDSRIKSLEKSRILKDTDNKEFTKIDGHVFIANLAEIVEIYNKLGNDLFAYNIRYGIKDELDVDIEIKKTLENNPDEFWFLNNGITMLVQDDEFAIKKTNCLEVYTGKNKVISVINGAQTITTSAEFFYKNADTSKVVSAREKAKVMLRIMHLNNVKKVENQEICSKEIDKISLSLNRQKPIQPEDVAYTTSFIYKINKINNDNPKDHFNFTIIRRGKHAVNNEYTLVDFSRSVKAYLEQHPGEARSKSKKELLDIETYFDEESGYSTYRFKDKGIFKDELINNEGSNSRVFNKYYKPVNFAMELQKYYSEKSSTIKKQLNDPEKIAILNYGKWYFVAYVIYVLNNNSNEDFTKFNAIFKFIDKKVIDESIRQFIDLFYQSILSLSEKDKVDSNQFKNEKLYNDFSLYKDRKQNSSLSIEIGKFDAYIKMNISGLENEVISNKEVAVTIDNG